MRIVIQSRVIQVISPEIVQYLCDRCGKICGTKENNKETWHGNGKAKHFCKKTCSPRDHPRKDLEHVRDCDLCFRDANAENDRILAEKALRVLGG